MATDAEKIESIKAAIKATNEELIKWVPYGETNAKVASVLYSFLDEVETILGVVPQ